MVIATPAAGVFGSFETMDIRVDSSPLFPGFAVTSRRSFSPGASVNAEGVTDKSTCPVEILETFSMSDPVFETTRLSFFS